MYISFVGSILLNELLSDDAPDEQKEEVSNFIEKQCELAEKLGFHLGASGFKVKIGSFSELDFAFCKGVVAGIEERGDNPLEHVRQLVGGFTNQQYLHDSVAHQRMPAEDNFIEGKSVFFDKCKALILIGGHQYAKMLGAWAINKGIPVFPLPLMNGYASHELWQHLASQNNDDGLIYSGVTNSDFEDLGIINPDPALLATNLFEMIEKSSKSWVRPSRLPEEMRYAPKSNRVIAKSVFVAMSFAEERQPVFDVIQQTSKESGFQCFRGDNQGFYSKNIHIMTNVTESIVRSHIVVVDISDRNPNVFYELGVADTLGKPVILLFDGKGDVPFDVNGLRHIRYDKDDLDVLAKDLAEVFPQFEAGI